MSGRRSLRPGVACAFALVAIFGPASAAAVDRKTEAAAREALKKALVDADSGAFDMAISGLEKAAAACGDSRCSNGMKAALLRDRGELLLKKGDKTAAGASFVEALKLDPTLPPNVAYDSPDLHAELEAAKDELSVANAKQPFGDLVHTPPAEAPVHAPLPILVEYTGPNAVAKVVVHYKSTGAGDYKRVVLTKQGHSFRGFVPCADVKRGVLRYYLDGFTSDDDPIAKSGSAREPFFVAIHAKVSGPAPSLPGLRPPKSCDECPGNSTSCDDNATDEDRDDHETKPVGEGARPSGPARAYARWWIGIAGSVDFLSLAQATDVCKLSSSATPASSAGYYCTHPDGTDFPSRKDGTENGTLAPGNAGTTTGSFTGRDIRILATIDYALSASFLVGGRLGYVLNTYPGSAAAKDGHGLSIPIHFELRATYLFGDEPLAHVGFAPYAFAGGGLSEFDAQTTTMVQQTGVNGQRPFQAWIVGGPAFVSLGGGVRYAFSPRSGFSVGARGTGVFGGVGFLPTLAPELALHYGF